MLHDEHPEWAALDPEALGDLLVRIENSESVLLLEPRDVYDYALCDLIDSADAEDRWTRQGGRMIAVYDETACIEAIMAWLECDSDDAWEWFGVNTSGAWVGEGTPTFRASPEDEDEGADVIDIHHHTQPDIT